MRYLIRQFRRFLWPILAVLASILVFTAPVTAGETITYYHSDALGSPIAATDESGALLWKEAYRPFGQKIRNEDGGTNRIGYTGHVHDNNTGLDYMGARYYDPMLGRFMGIDPAGVVEGNIHSFNRYSYANNNPYKYVDPDGRMSSIAKLLLNVASKSKKITKVGKQLKKNSARGKQFENQVEKTLKKKQHEVGKEITIKTKSGTKTRMDFLTKNKKGEINCIECKSSKTAPLTKNQKTAFPEIGKTGGEIVGKGKPGFPGGTKISPTKVKIIRP